MAVHTRPDEIDRALDRCLEAALNPSLWPQILEDLSASSASMGAAVIPIKSRSPGALISTDSLKPGLESYFANGWHINDWRLNGVPLLARNGTARDQEYTTLENFKRLEFYRWQAGLGLGKSCIIGFASGDDMLGLVLHRRLSSDFFSDEEAAVFQRARERLMVAAHIARGLSASRVSGMADAFDLSGIAAVFFDRFCRVTTVTSAADRLLGPDIDIRNHVFVSPFPGTSTAIRKAMQATLSERWLVPGQTPPSVLIERNGKRPLLLRIQRLGGNLLDIFTHSVGVCLIEDPELKHAQDVSGLRGLFGISATEASVALMVSNDMSLRDIAATRGTSYHTVRTQLRSIFQKTGTTRQSQLAKLIANLGRTSHLYPD